MDFLNCPKYLIVLVLLGLLSTPCSALEPIGSSVDSATQESTGHLKKDNSEGIASPGQNEVSTNSDSWFGHAAKSYAFWQQGNKIEAIREEESAVKLNPANADLLTNLAIMKQDINAYGEAIDLYWRAARLAPNNWVAPLGITRCYILSGDESRGRKLLQMMSGQKDCDFQWYYMIAKTWLGLEDLSMTEQTVTKAVSVATKQEQKAAAENLLFLVLLKTNKLDKAKTLQEQVFHVDLPRVQETYVRAATTLLPINDPAAGKDLLKCADANLTTNQDASTFLKLGRVFMDKATDSKCASTDRAPWLDCAQAAYTQAIVLNPKSPDPHLALASVYTNKGDITAAVDELKKTMSLERLDILAGFLVSKLQNCQTAGTEETIPINLSLVKFKISGLTCACHLSRVQNALRNIKGVAFISTPPKKPYTGFVLVDQSQTPAREMLATCVQNYRPGERKPSAVADKDLAEKEKAEKYLAEKDPAEKASPEKAHPEKAQPEKLQLEMVSEKPVRTVDGALKIAEDIRFGPIISFKQTYADHFNRFRDIEPIKPVDYTGTAPGVVTATNWPAPL
jgi:tetratricopeptide (TPR) repeat protein